MFRRGCARFTKLYVAREALKHGLAMVVIAGVIRPAVD
jgi:hypothetical protein